MKQLVVLTGAGISAESGLKTFRDSDGFGWDMMFMKLLLRKAGEKIRHWFLNSIT